jgi:hypothetical protein
MPKDLLFALSCWIVGLVAVTQTAWAVRQALRVQRKYSRAFTSRLAERSWYPGFIRNGGIILLAFALIFTVKVFFETWGGRLIESYITTKQHQTVERVHKEFAHATPIGSSRSAVENYLSSRSIPHSYIDDSRFPNEHRVEVALIRGFHRGLIRRDVQIRFHFDESGRLTDYSVHEVFTGP